MTPLIMSSPPIPISSRFFRCRYLNFRDVVASSPSFSRRKWSRASHLHEKKTKGNEHETKGVLCPVAEMPLIKFIEAAYRQSPVINRKFLPLCHRKTRLRCVLTNAINTMRTVGRGGKMRALSPPPPPLTGSRGPLFCWSKIKTRNKFRVLFYSNSLIVS